MEVPLRWLMVVRLKQNDLKLAKPPFIASCFVRWPTAQKGFWMCDWPLETTHQLICSSPLPTVLYFSMATSGYRASFRSLSRGRRHGGRKIFCVPLHGEISSFRWISPSWWPHAGNKTIAIVRRLEGECFWCASTLADIQPLHKVCQRVLKYQKGANLTP